MNRMGDKEKDAEGEESLSMINSPSSTTGDAGKTPQRTSTIVDSFRVCGLAGIRIDKEELRQNLTMPKYLRHAMRDSIRLQDPAAGESRVVGGAEGEENGAVAPRTPMVVFINPRSGGRSGPVLKEKLQHLMSEEQVIILFLLLSFWWSFLLLS